MTEERLCRVQEWKCAASSAKEEEGGEDLEDLEGEEDLEEEEDLEGEEDLEEEHLEEEDLEGEEDLEEIFLEEEDLADFSSSHRHFPGKPSAHGKPRRWRMAKIKTSSLIPSSGEDGMAVNQPLALLAEALMRR